MEKVEKTKRVNKLGIPQCCIAHILFRTVDESDFVLDALNCTLNTSIPVTDTKSTWRNTRLLNRSIAAYMIPGLIIGEHKFNLLDDTHLDATIHTNDPVYFNKNGLLRTYGAGTLQLYLLRRNIRDGSYEVCDLLHNEWFKISSKPKRFYRLLMSLDPQWAETQAWSYDDEEGPSRDRQKLGLLLKRFDRLIEYIGSEACDRELCRRT